MKFYWSNNFKINYKKGEIFENLKLFKSNLVITRVFPSGKAQKWSLEPYWTKVDLLNTSPNEYKLVLKSREKVVLLGAFLNLNDKKKLMKRINDALLMYKTTAKA